MAKTYLATLDEKGKIPSSQLPSYVDDVLEYSSKASFPTTGEASKIYVDTTANLTYRWSGSKYVEISPSLAIGETSSTAYRGDRGKVAYDHSQTAHAPSNAQQNVQSDWNATSGDAFIKNKPNIPTKVGELTNDKDYATKTDVTEAIDDIEIGGRNLLVGTKDFSGDWNNKKYWDVSSETYKGFTVMSRTGAWSGLGQYVEGVVGETYTFSGYVKKTGGGILVYANGTGDIINNGIYIWTENNKWVHFSVTATVSISGSLRFRVENASDGETTYVCGLKLEEGNKPTPWTPAIEDTEAEIQSVDNKLTTNLLKPTLGTTTQNGVTCTNNGDGTYTLNGTATKNTWFKAKNPDTFDGIYKLVGCPKGGESTSYFLEFISEGGSSVMDSREIGEGSVYKYDGSKVYISIGIRSGITVDNLLFKPMLTTNLNATYDDFVPFTGSTGQLNSDVAELKGEIDSLKKSVSDGKSTVATAITGMGQTTASDASFDTMATNIGNITPTQTVSGKTVTAKINGKNSVSTSVADGSIGNITMSGPYKNNNTGKYDVLAYQTNTAGYYDGEDIEGAYALESANATATGGSASTSVSGMETTSTDTGFSVSASATGGSASVSKGYTTGASNNGQNASETKYIIAGSVSTDASVPSGTTPTGLSFGKKVKVAKGYHNTDKYYSVPNQSDGTKAVVTASSPSISITSVSKNSSGKFVGTGSASTSVSVGTAGYISSSAGTKNGGTASATVTLDEYKSSSTGFNVTFNKKKLHVSGSANAGSGYASSANHTSLIDSDYGVSNTNIASLVGRHDFVELATCPTNPRNGFAHFDGYKYIYVGGGNADTTKKVYKYNIKENIWTTLDGTMNDVHEYNSSVLVGDTIMCFGYNTTSSSVPIEVLPLHAYNGIQGKFTINKYIPSGAQKSNCAVNTYTGNVFFVSSLDSTYSNYTWIYNYLTQTWTEGRNGKIQGDLSGGIGENRNTIYLTGLTPYNGPSGYAITNNGKIVSTDFTTYPYSEPTTITNFGSPIYGPSFLITEGSVDYAYCLAVQYTNCMRIVNLSDKTETTIWLPGPHFPYLSTGCIANGDIYYFGGSASENGSTRINVQRRLDMY